ncbi:hypothetical protein TFLX_04869 [Thermoflexales bacterium]|nr:hypothetical protein TFLX_04869 [Thermoflexales bacterium]
MKRKAPTAWLLAILASLLMAVGAQALTLITNTTSGGSSPDAPLNLNPGWRFTVKADTVPGEAVCVEVHPMGDTGNFMRTQCVFSGGSTPYNWTCNVFTSGVPQTFRSKTVQYQFHAATDDTNCQGNVYAYTGFNWTFNTEPLAVSLQALSAESLSAAPPWLVAGLMVAVGGASLLILWRLLKFRQGSC